LTFNGYAEDAKTIAVEVILPSSDICSESCLIRMGDVIDDSVYKNGTVYVPDPEISRPEFIELVKVLGRRKSTIIYRSTLYPGQTKVKMDKYTSVLSVVCYLSVMQCTENEYLKFYSLSSVMEYGNWIDSQLINDIHFWHKSYDEVNHPAVYKKSMEFINKILEQIREQSLM